MLQSTLLVPSSEQSDPNCSFSFLSIGLILLVFFAYLSSYTVTDEAKRNAVINALRKQFSLSTIEKSESPQAVSFTEDQLFRTNQDQLRTAVINQLSSIAQEIKSENATLNIIYTGSSAARAAALYRYFLDAGLTKEQLKIQSQQTRSTGKVDLIKQQRATNG